MLFELAPVFLAMLHALDTGLFVYSTLRVFEAF